MRSELGTTSADQYANSSSFVYDAYLRSKFACLLYIPVKMGTEVTV